MLLLAIILLVMWAAGAFAPMSPYRGNNLTHILLVVGVCVLVYWALTGGVLRHHLR